MCRRDRSGRVASLLAIIALLIPAIAAGADPKDCGETASTQAELNQCAASGLKAANDELNRVYQAILAKYKDDRRFLEKLRQAQRAWLVFRDADLAARFPLDNKQARYGSVYPRCANLVVTQRTQERIRHLREWLDGVEEGDVCAGSVQYKSAP